MKGALGNLMKQVQNMQAEMEKAKEELAAMEITGEAGGGMVRVTLTGARDARRVEIAPELVTEDRDMLEDLVAAAINDANRKVEKMTQEKMSNFTQGLNLPPGFNLPF